MNGGGEVFGLFCFLGFFNKTCYKTFIKKKTEQHYIGFFLLFLSRLQLFSWTFVLWEWDSIEQEQNPNTWEWIILFY